jgi:hypothetical protein
MAEMAVVGDVAVLPNTSAPPIGRSSSSASSRAASSPWSAAQSARNAAVGAKIMAYNMAE